MNKLFTMLYNHPLFKGMKEVEITDILSKLKRQRYKDEQIIYSIGKTQFSIGFILSGLVSINKIDYWGNRSIITKLTQGEIFAEAFSFSNIEELPVNIVAHKDSEVLFITRAQFGFFSVKYPQLMQNMLYIMATKNHYLTQKIDIISKRKTREKILAYLSQQVEMQRAYTFSIPLNRNELADFLSVDRSALSSELSKMRQEGILQYHKNTFTLL